MPVYKTLLERSLINFLPDIGTDRGLFHNKWNLEKILQPTYEGYRALHNRVGKPYGWDLRARINDSPYIQELLEKNSVELWQFKDNVIPIGYSLFTCADDKSAEIEDFGFFPEFCHKGYGHFFMVKILERLKERGIQKVWLTTRSTNHPKVVDFYRREGFTVVGRAKIAPDV